MPDSAFLSPAPRADIRFPADVEVARWLARESLRAEEAALGVARKRLGVFALDRAGHIVGGTVCLRQGGDLYLHLLWVEKARRGTGIGAALLLATEAAGLARGCTRVYLNTMDFQGPRFYPRFGYESVGVMPDFVYGQARHYLRKAAVVAEAPALPGGLTLLVTDHPTPEQEKAVDDGLTAHWLEHVDVHYQELSTTLRDHAGTALAALNGVVDGDWFTIVDLFVAPAHRGKGLVRRLLAETHAHVAHLGCRWSTVMPMDYQHPDVLARLGFAPVLRVDDYLLGHGRTWMRREIGGTA
ncbi:GNAT family N-acetyltransferase [Aerophototrophica crusticola]|uniref:GNAT family N-acetyltransferase n=1 Tax=Aerophototrophica crusticola TaxID=1709002 RepID=A0A858R8C3_9PROT|nr:GNAT family N-acetyltransferase [Rhodospirillaceae bacterium B3]